MGKLQMEGKKRKLAMVVTIFFLGVLTTFHISQVLGSVGTVRKIKVVVDGLPGEADIEDNMKEKEVSISPIGFTDLAVTDITLSPKFIVDSDTVTVSVEVKNKGNETAKVRFCLQSDQKIANWELRVVDSTAKEIAVFNGKGQPPEYVSMKTTKEDGKVQFKVGEPYSSVFILTDYQGNQHHFLGKAFSFETLMYEVKEGKVISLSLKSLFEKDGTFLSSDGKERLLEVASVMKRHPNHSLEVKMLTYDKSLGEQQIKELSSYLSKQLILPEDVISIKLTIDEKVAYPSIDISSLNKIK